MKRQLGPESGSSPLARGLLGQASAADGMIRIIPARAGFTYVSPHKIASCLDHPRSRGVYQWRRRRRAWCPGSSPLARGLRRPRPRRSTIRRIIPARAGFTPHPPIPFTSGPDHPRSRGVYLYRPCDRSSMSGSSPLARGLREHRADEDTRHRIIPARAGFTAGTTPATYTHTDHPRSRGVYTSEDHPGRRARGSSPLARGLPPPKCDASTPIRIIPARAGFTADMDAVLPFSQDHPRSRGVYKVLRAWLESFDGSSPLARGLPQKRGEDVAPGGIIPARAGFTWA